MDDNDETSLTPQTADKKGKQDQEELSVEDLAWADSCLIVDPEISETNMDSLKEALLNILDYHSEIFNPSENELDLLNDITAPGNEHSGDETNMNEDSGDEKGMNEDSGDESPDVLSLSPLKHPFLPNFNDEMMKVRYSDSDCDDDLGFQLMESGLEDIFKVWDLDIPVEEDELVKELEEALSLDKGSQVGRNRMKGLKMEALDSLVESIADLSLK